MRKRVFLFISLFFFTNEVQPEANILGTALIIALILALVAGIVIFGIFVAYDSDPTQVVTVFFPNVV